MPKTQIACPQCRQPMLAEVRQVFDLNEDPRAKALLLSGAVNLAQCPHCGYQGQLATPIIYHDPEKELLLVYVPPELGLHRDTQEQAIGPLLNQIVNRLPPEKRKAYLLQPQTVLTFESLVERILEADGITKEMLQEQEKRLRLIQRLAMASEQGRLEILRQEDALVDASFFALLARLAELSAATGDRAGLQRLREVERLALEHSTFGRKVKEEEAEVKAALEALEALGPRPTLEQVLELFLANDSETRLRTLVSLLRPALNYAFFQALSERIEQAEGETKERLTRLRERLLALSEEVDQAVAARVQAAQQLLEQLLQAEDLEAALTQALPAVDDFFLSVVEQALREARQKGDLQRSARINQLVETLQRLTAPPPEVQLINALLNAPDEAARQQVLEQHAEQVNDDLLNALSALVAQYEQTQQVPQEIKERLRAAYRQALRFAMQRKMKAS